MAARIQHAVSARWGLPMSAILRDLHAQDLTRKQAAEAIGMGYQNFAMMLRKHPDLNPWGTASVVTQYLQDTGESLGAALARLASEGYTLNAASKAIGFAKNSSLRYAMRVRGIEVNFPERKAKPKVPARPRSAAVKWPTWAKVFAMTPDMGGSYLSAWRKGAQHGQV